MQCRAVWDGGEHVRWSASGGGFGAQYAHRSWHLYDNRLEVGCAVGGGDHRHHQWCGGLSTVRTGIHNCWSTATSDRPACRIEPDWRAFLWVQLHHRWTQPDRGRRGSLLLWGSAVCRFVGRTSAERTDCRRRLIDVDSSGCDDGPGANALSPFYVRWMCRSVDRRSSVPGSEPQSSYGRL